MRNLVSKHADEVSLWLNGWRSATSSRTPLTRDTLVPYRCPDLIQQSPVGGMEREFCVRHGIVQIVRER